MHYLMQVQKGIEYIEANLDDEIFLHDVAKQAGISQWHFQRIFKALTNETLKTYIRSRRLSIAFENLLTTDKKIIDISIAAGFESQESFTRAFKKAFDMTPNEARKVGNKNLFLNKVQFDAEYLRHININLSLTPEIVTQERMQLVGVKTEFYSVDSEKNNMADKLPLLWDEFVPRMEEVKHKVSGLAYGVIQQTKEKTDLLEYYAAVEVSDINDLPEGMANVEIPTSTYAKFTHKGNVASINNTVNYIYSSWLMQSGKRHTYGADLEVYGEEYIPDSDDSVVYCSIPIK
ncbi:Transcriptional regulator, AraC family [gamma proteobacterium IMCC1989]|nr:Transcriptional regulator, AraC family [gamma proteobacterium IMCC1989]